MIWVTTFGYGTQWTTFGEDMIVLWLACAITKTTEQVDTATVEEVSCVGEGPLITSSTGCIEGVSYQGLSMFLGIPYAEPPVGELRWKRPEPISDWDGIKKADVLSSACVQDDGFGGVVGSEDCLTLNIFRPADWDGITPLPILFFTHGGSFVAGMGSSNVFEAPPELATKAIVVTHNYRLGAMGFLAHEELTNEDATAYGGTGTSGNLGIMDTLAALQWVYDNARAIGGTTDQIMIFGESAGAVSTCVLLFTDESEGLFSSALIQSGACTSLLNYYKPTVPPVPLHGKKVTTSTQFAP